MDLLLMVACKTPPPFVQEWAAPCAGGTEVQDGVDDDCDGLIDEGEPSTADYSGCGAAAEGGAGGVRTVVTTLDDTGPGSLREALAATGPLRVEFSVAGTIFLESPLSIQTSYVTVDGASAPAPGITLIPAKHQVAMEVREAHDVILSHLRFDGRWSPGDAPFDGEGALQLVGTQIGSWNLVVDHVTILNANDVGLDVWGRVHDVTLSWNLITHSRHPSTISHHPAPYLPRDCISIHHDLYVENGIRNPQLRADSQRVDFADNLVADWGFGNPTQPLGLTVRDEDGEPSVSALIHDNTFLSDDAPEAALVYGNAPGGGDDGGPESAVPPGTLVTGSRMGDLWIHNNSFPSEEIDDYSTVDEPFDMPILEADPEAPGDLIRGAGCRYRTEEEAEMLGALERRL